MVYNFFYVCVTSKLILCVKLHIAFSSTYKLPTLRMVYKCHLQLGVSQMFISVENLCSHTTYIRNSNTRSLYFEQTLHSLQVDKVWVSEVTLLSYFSQSIYQGNPDLTRIYKHTNHWFYISSLLISERTSFSSIFMYDGICHSCLTFCHFCQQYPICVLYCSTIYWHSHTGPVNCDWLEKSVCLRAFITLSCLSEKRPLDF
jgi:hypothetical protein